MNLEPLKLKLSLLDFFVSGQYVSTVAYKSNQQAMKAIAEAKKNNLHKSTERYRCFVRRDEDGTLRLDTENDRVKADYSDFLFPLPDGWEWHTLYEISTLISDGTHKTPKYVEKGVKFISVQNISSGVLSFDKAKYITDAECQELDKRSSPQRNDLLICRIGTLGKPIVVETDEKFQIFVSLGLIRLALPEMAKYVCYYLNSGIAKKYIDHVKIGGGTHTFKINLEDLATFPIPIPPLNQQKEIVERIEALLPRVNEYEQTWNLLESLNERFPLSLEKSVIQYAVQGKLVPQDLKDGAAASLLEAVAKEKKMLIAQRRIKKTKTTHPIEENEIPFNIPDSWIWCRLGDVSSYLESKTKVASNEIGSDEWSLDLEDIEKNTGRIHRFFKATDRKIVGEKVRFVKGQILYSKLRPYLKKILVAPGDGICTPELVPFDMYGGIDPYYIVYVLKSPYVDDLINSVTYGVKMPRVGTDTMANLLIPIPPLPEQKRIVSKLNEVLPLCGGLNQLSC